MGKEIDSSQIDSGEADENSLRTIQQVIPGREENELYFKDKSLLFVGLQKDLYAAYWRSPISALRFVDALSRLSVSPASESLLFDLSLREHLPVTFKELSDELSSRNTANFTFIRVNTRHLDFTWERGRRRPYRPAVVGLMGDQVDRKLLRNYYTLTTRNRLPGQVYSAVADLLKPFPSFRAGFK